MICIVYNCRLCFHYYENAALFFDLLIVKRLLYLIYPAIDKYYVDYTKKFAQLLVDYIQKFTRFL